MALLSMRGVSLSFGGQQLLDKVDLQIESGDRACLVGRNGTGKSSLLKLLCRTFPPDSGEIQCARTTRIAYLPQDVPLDVTGRVAEIVETGLHLSGSNSGEPDPREQQAIATVLSHLGLERDTDFTTLSGGQKRRVLLARSLVCEPNLLLLDEPTNHLDIDSIRWLEGFLLRHCKTLLFVTHDRALLRRLANRIIDLDRGRLAHWACDYDTFLRRKAGLLHDEQAQQAVFDRKLAKEEEWIRQGIKARRTRNEGRVRVLMQMRKERRVRRQVEGTARMHAQHAEQSGRKVIEARNVSFAFGGEPPVVHGFSARLLRGDKVGIIGPNGSGKTTLLRLFAGQLEPRHGELVHGTHLQIAYFDQHRDVLDDEASVVENVGNGKETFTIDGTSRHVIGYLQDFLFAPDRAQAPVKVLSGGERNRLLLARLFATPSNVLVMDEPTNDLDVETLELLEEQILNYQGTVLVVSHDRAFLNNLVTSLLVLEGDGIVREYVGSYDDWLAARTNTARSGNRKAAGPRPERKQKTFGYKQKRELEALPEKIETLETKQAELHVAMAAPGYFRAAPERLALDNRRNKELGRELEALYSRWEELETARAL